jgi:S-adenosylmethionine:tRNA ribosyltransferase-isomerase
MKLDDFDYHLPAAAIAHKPHMPRHQAKLLDMRHEQMQDKHVIDLPSYINSNDLIIVNNTKVIPARLKGKAGRSQAYLLHCISKLPVMNGGLLPSRQRNYGLMM